MKNLYETLGVDKTASGEEIKKAYRKKSKKIHPDHGGNAMEFANVATAYRLLTNPQTRSEYDRTGDVKQFDPDKAIYDTVAGIFYQALDKAIDDLESMDILEAVREHFRESSRQGKEVRKKAEGEIEKLKKASKKLKFKKTDIPNLLQNVFDNRIQDLESKSAEVERHEFICIGALKYLENFEYAFEKQTFQMPMMQYGGFTVRMRTY